MYHTLKWFQNRIGKRVFRGPTGCKCTTCKEIEENGKFIHGQDDAQYLFEVQYDLDINYRDKK